MSIRGNKYRIWTKTDDLLDIYKHRGPFVTVHLHTPGDEENAAQQNETDWQSERRRLEELGAPLAALQGIDELISDAHKGGSSLFAVASAAGVHHASYWDVPLLNPFSDFSALPRLVPLLNLRQGLSNFITVVADRTGADLSGVVMDAEAPQTDHVDGVDKPLRKVQAGGWSHLRYHHRAENTWDKNARDVVEHLVAMVDKVKPRVVFLAGDVRAVQKIQSDLPTQLNYGASVEVVDGSRADDGGENISQEMIKRCFAKLEMEDTLAITDKFAEELGEHDRAAVGAVGVISALQKTQVETLLVESGRWDDRLAWVGPDAAHIGNTKDEVEAMGTDDVIQVMVIGC